MTSTANKLTARQVSEIRKHYEAGESDETLAVWYDCNKGTIRWHTRDIRRVKVGKIDKATLIQLRAEGSSRAAIARRFNVSWQAVHWQFEQMDRRAA